jgi:hypothetical protein
MFASRTLLAHLTRGVVGLGALALSVIFGTNQPWLLLICLPIALVALRGCPICWTIGLVETVVAKFTGAAPAGSCTDGRCRK